MSFIRTKEDFVCGHCGASVKGNGYTNHCPKCLWSKHVDVQPGDRQEECGGLMKPVDIFLRKRGTWVIVHLCETCGEKRNNRVSEEDDFDEVVRLEKEIVDKRVKR
ncbi:MAG: RNHCP domain-containing protein [bacterium]